MARQAVPGNGRSTAKKKDQKSQDKASLNEANGAPDNGGKTPEPSTAIGWRDGVNNFLGFVNRNQKLLAVIVASVALALITYWVFDKLSYYYLARSYIDQIAEVFDLNKHLANALVLVAFAAITVFGNLFYSFSKRRRYMGAGGLLALLIANSLILYAGTRDKKIDRAGAAIKCYVMTRDGTITYGERPGIDPSTGRRCIPVTPEMLERLSQYEKGRRPQRVASANPTFFEPRSGEPIVWYVVTGGKSIELFDLMGFHPETGEELLVVSRDVVENWKKQNQIAQQRTPQQINPQQYAFFDPRTGQPRVWYWRKEVGVFEFYDADGYHPSTGDKLVLFTRDERERLEQEVRDKELEQKKKAAEEDQKRQQIQQQREAERQQNDLIRRQQEAERRQREEEQLRVSQAGQRCDSLAANPNDARKAGEGVSFEQLRSQATEAISTCEIAVSQNPQELRFKYQLARALQWTSRQRAFDLQQELARARYPAAFDNLGWLFITEKKDHARAVAMFKMGADANDSDSMISLGEMIERGHHQVDNPNEMKLRLYCRAGQLGNQGGVRACDNEAQKAQVAEQTRAQQLQQQQMMMQFMGNVLGSIRR